MLKMDAGVICIVNVDGQVTLNITFFLHFILKGQQMSYFETCTFYPFFWLLLQIWYVSRLEIELLRKAYVVKGQTSDVNMTEATNIQID